MSARRRLAAAMLVGSLCWPAWAVQPDEVLPDPQMEARARAISAELRCYVCQNQSIDDSDADLARDLRLLVRERLVAGDTDEAVEAFIVQRYGEFVLLKPRFGWHTVLLWSAPVLILTAGGLALLLARRSGTSAASTLSADEEQRLQAILRKE